MAAEKTAEIKEKDKDPKSKKPGNAKGTKKKENRIRQFFSKLKATFGNEKLHKIAGLLMFLFSGYLFISLTSFLFTWKADQDKILEITWYEFLFQPDLTVDNWLGKLGALTSHIFIHDWFGIASFLFVFLFFLAGFRILLKISLVPLKKTFKYSFFALLWVSSFLGHVISNSDLLFLGGRFGFQVSQWLSSILGNIGTTIFLVFVLLIFSVVTFNLSFDWIKKLLVITRRPVLPVTANTAETEGSAKNMLQDETIFEKDKVTTVDFVVTPVDPEEKPDLTKPSKKENLTNDVELIIETPAESDVPATLDEVDQKSKDLVEEFGAYDPTLDLPDYQFPGTDLLNEYGSSAISVNTEELEANKNKIVETLSHYGITIKEIKAVIGPTVTLYEIVPKEGIRISKIRNLGDDIALSLSALGIRIIAPMPGKGTIGIEVPNQKPQTVSMKTLLESEKFRHNSYDLPCALGKTISNETYVADLAKMPHLLMAGATGQGKSVGLNAILVSLLYKKHPSQIKFILVDPKRVELTLFNKIERHFLAKLPDAGEAIITDTKKVVNTLNSLCIEMDQRYSLLQEAGVRNLKEYNVKFVERRLNPEKGHRFLPYIVLVVDEFADLILTAGKEVETPIQRLAQLARAIGIHLIIATQRPSVNIITGTIKANFPTRIAFRVSSGVDSKTILDTNGAEQLIGRGDMLLSMGSDMIRLQCGFVDTPEVDKITEFIGNQKGYSDAFHLPEYVGDEDGEAGEVDLSDKDSMFDEAARIVVQHQQGSASLLQRRLKLGYNRAGRLIDQLEAAGIIGPFEGSKARQVLIHDVMALEEKLKNMNGGGGANG